MYIYIYIIISTCNIEVHPQVIFQQQPNTSPGHLEERVELIEASGFAGVACWAPQEYCFSAMLPRSRGNGAGEWLVNGWGYAKPKQQREKLKQHLVGKWVEL